MFLACFVLPPAFPVDLLPAGSVRKLQIALCSIISRPLLSPEKPAVWHGHSKSIRAAARPCPLRTGMGTVLSLRQNSQCHWGTEMAVTVLWLSLEGSSRQRPPNHSPRPHSPGSGPSVMILHLRPTPQFRADAFIM